MKLNKPEVKFVPIDLSINADNASCPANTAWYGTGGGQYCKASQIDAKYCPNWVDDIDWNAPMPGR